MEMRRSLVPVRASSESGRDFQQKRKMLTAIGVGFNLNGGENIERPSQLAHRASSSAVRPNPRFQLLKRSCERMLLVFEGPTRIFPALLSVIRSIVASKRMRSWLMINPRKLFWRFDPNC